MLFTHLTTIQSSTVQVDCQVATGITRRYIDPRLTITSIRKLYGGSINRVQQWFSDGLPEVIVAKLNSRPDGRMFEREMAYLELFRDQTQLPVPEPFAWFSNDIDFGGSGLLMGKVDAVTLSDARLSPAGVRYFQHELARHLAALHDHHRETYGSVLDPVGQTKWLDAYQPAFEMEFRAVRDVLSSRSREIVDRLILHLDQWLPEESRPTLIHGDLWATNILIDDSHPDKPGIKAFIDASASYCDPAYELAYLRIFHTAGDEFFSVYSQYHPLGSSFHRRCRVYWLGTLMMQLRLYGHSYLPACEKAIQDIAGYSHSTP